MDWTAKRCDGLYDGQPRRTISIPLEDWQQHSCMHSNTNSVVDRVKYFSTIVILFQRSSAFAEHHSSLSRTASKCIMVYSVGALREQSESLPQDKQVIFYNNSKKFHHGTNDPTFQEKRVYLRKNALPRGFFFSKCEEKTRDHRWNFEASLTSKFQPSVERNHRSALWQKFSHYLDPTHGKRYNRALKLTICATQKQCR